MARVIQRPRDTIQEKFEAFHTLNPWVYEELVRLSYDWKQTVGDRAGIEMFFAVMRWERRRATRGDEFDLNNNFTSRYARKIMREHPELDGIFELRELRSR